MAKQYHKNPRQITAKQYEALAIDLAELGDLGGIVHDLNSDEIIGGNQRSRVFDINACDVVLTEELHEPDAQGTVAHGYVLWRGNKYAYRLATWEPSLNPPPLYRPDLLQIGAAWAGFRVVVDSLDAAETRNVVS